MKESPTLMQLIDLAAEASGKQDASTLSALCATTLCALKAIPPTLAEQALSLAVDNLPALIDEVVAEERASDQ